MRKEELHQYFRAFTYALFIFALFSLYHFLRQGLYDLGIINKVLGTTAALVGGFTLIVGPLHRKFASFARFMGIRKELGLLAFAIALAHVAVTLMLQDHFKFPDYYIRINFPLYFGVLALLIWVYMAHISNAGKIKQMGSIVWIKVLSLSGKIAFISIFLHLTVMKYPEWLTWFKGQTKQTSYLANPELPPASLFVGAIMLSIIIFRIINDLINRNPNKINPVNVPPQNLQNPPLTPPASQA